MTKAGIDAGGERLGMTGDCKAEDRTSLASKLALLDELRQAEIRATSSQVASVIAHMIGTPLNVIVGRAALLRANPTPESMVDNARRIEEQAQRLTQRVRRLIHYLTAPEPHHESRPTSAVIDDAIDLYLPIAEQHQVSLKGPAGEAPDVQVEGLPTLMVLAALISLAIRTSRRGEEIELDVTGAPDERGVVFSITMPGMEAPERPVDRLDPPVEYEPDNVEREQLLSVCAAIAKKNGGRLELNEHGAGVLIRFHCIQAEG